MGSWFSGCTHIEYMNTRMAITKMITRVMAHALASDKLSSVNTKIRHNIVINTTVKKEKKTNKK